ncbi:hypothetical protein CO046_04480 [Candidatus Peregrinibacteria bacterium CG_4_9_14_0_2_um_filter_53_11]|nr:MAG: hypothetical protein CO046_04480 [Candidatus Peregrinibacteria bacterium CG_4_9_14_0_2_um_filter_53_11]
MNSLKHLRQKALFVLVFSAQLLTALLLPSTVFAQKSASDILPDAAVKNVDGAGSAVPTGDLLNDLIPKSIKIFLGLVATITVGLIIYAGVMLIVAQGNEDEYKKFKTMLVWSVVGLGVMITAYGVVRGVLQLVFQ